MLRQEPLRSVGFASLDTAPHSQGFSAGEQDGAEQAAIILSILLLLHGKALSYARPTGREGSDVAELQLEGGELVLHLSGAEKAEAVHGDLRVPVSSAVLTAVHHAPSKVVMTRDCSCRFSDPTTCAPSFVAGVPSQSSPSLTRSPGTDDLGHRRDQE